MKASTCEPGSARASRAAVDARANRTGTRQRASAVRRALLCFFILLPFSFCLRASGQSYSIDWYKTSGGGGTSTGGVYSASSSVGQHDAGTPVTGGIFSLTGGFWALYAVQVPGVPPLNIFRTVTNTAVVAWPSWPTNFVLQQNASLDTTNWLTVTNAPIEVNGTNQVVIRPFTGSRFYRLKQPATP